MKPKTLFEKEVVAMYGKMRPLAESYRRIAYKMSVPHIAYKRPSGKCFCLDCGCEFQDSGDNEYVVCPHCRTKLKVSKTMRRKHHQICWWNFLTTQNGYQVIRGYCLDVHQEIRRPAAFTFDECSRQYVNEHLQHVTIARKLRMYWWRCYNPFRLDSDMELRCYLTGVGGENKYEIGWDAYTHRLMKALDHCGYRNTDDSPVNTILKCLSNPHWQTLLECGYTSVFRLVSRDMERLWPQLKICIRNKYRIDDVSLWRDVMSNLEELHLDMHSPKYVCPADIRELHQQLMRRIDRKREAERREREKEKLLNATKYNPVYVKKKGKFFGIHIIAGAIEIKVLESIESFEEEGREMHHCVFTNKYFENEDSLILSATENGERIATIEYDLINFKVLQCRAKFNKTPEQYDELIKLMDSNKSRFVNAKRKRKAV